MEVDRSSTTSEQSRRAQANGVGALLAQYKSPLNRKARLYSTNREDIV